MRISVAFCIYNDFDFIQDVLNSIPELVDEIVFLDGPYNYCKPVLSELGLLYDQDNSPLKKYTKNIKVVYEYGVYENEREKRIKLYNMCSGDIVMLLDSDELILDFNRNELNRFWTAGKSVGCISIHNLVRRNVAFGKRTKKFVFFKKEKISAEQHLNYTWLVGVNQEKPDRSIMYQQPIAEVAHLTLMRSAYFNVVKFCFYTRLYFYTREMHDEVGKIFGYDFKELNNAGLSKSDITEIFRRSMPALINYSTDEGLERRLLPKLDVKYDLLLESDNICNSQQATLLKGAVSYHYLTIPIHLKKGDTFYYSFIIDNSSEITIKSLQHNFHKSFESSKTLEINQNGIVHASIMLEDDAKNIFAVLLGFSAKAKTGLVSKITSFTQKKVLAIYGNCQVESIRDYLLLNDAFIRTYAVDVTPGRLVHMMDEHEVKEFKQGLYRVDYLICQPLRDNYRGSKEYETNSILNCMRDNADVFILPNLFFTGYAPDQYCLTYQKNYLRSPMPVHDINFIYSYLRFGGQRGDVSDDFLRKLESVSFYSNDFLEKNYIKNLKELKTRENLIIDAYPKSKIKGFIYSEFLERWSNELLTHYSDAHPTEFVFEKIGELILGDLNCSLSETHKTFNLPEKGVLPFYKSALQFYNLLQDQKIHINNVEVSFDQFFNSYCDEYDKINKNELFGYIEKLCVKVIITNHKTGTILMLNIFREYCNKYGLKMLELNSHLSVNSDKIDAEHNFQQYDFIFTTYAQHFKLLIDSIPEFKYRAIHLIRNPFEIIMSGVRYHQITDEGWCNKKLFVKQNGSANNLVFDYKKIASYDADSEYQIGDYSYKEIMTQLSEKNRVKFEILNHSSTFGTINAIDDFISNFKDDGNVATIQLESISTPACIRHVFNFLALDENFYEIYADKVGSKEWLGEHATKKSARLSFLDIFDDELHKLFTDEFGGKIVENFGYTFDGSTMETETKETKDKRVRPHKIP